MAGLAQTDSEGRFTLENIPPGRYYVAGGRLDLQTYYPGTQTMTDATVVTVTAGTRLTGIDFSLRDTSAGRAPSGFANLSATIPVRVTVENGGKVPVSGDGTLSALRLESSNAAVVTIPINSGTFNLAGPVFGNFSVMVEGLPDTYVVKSILYGTTDITHGTFRLTPANFHDALRPPTTPPSTVSVTLGLVKTPRSGGVRVSGRSIGSTKGLVYISGRPGILFSDGTFEFNEVPPGRHGIAATSPTGAAGAVIVVGDKDIDGIELKQLPLLPADVRNPRTALPADEYAPGSMLPLARISGRVIDEGTKAPILEGNVLVKAGETSRTIPIGPQGQFETFYLLPGTYELRLQVFGHSTLGPTVVVDDRDVTLEVTTRRLY